MTKMAAISIYGKNLYKASSPELGVYDLKIGMQHWRLQFYKSGINDDLCLTLTYFTAWLKLVTCVFEWENCYKVIKWGKLQMTKLTEDLYYRKNTLLPQGVSAPAPGAIYMCMIITFKQLFLKTAWPIKPKLYVEPSWKEAM